MTSASDQTMAVKVARRHESFKVFSCRQASGSWHHNTRVQYICRVRSADGNSLMRLYHKQCLSQDFTLDFYLRQMWQDPRLNFQDREYKNNLVVSSSASVYGVVCIRELKHAIHLVNER